MKGISALKVFLITVSILLGSAMLAITGWALLVAILQPQQPTLTREEALAKFMPKQPEATHFMSEGYDPKTRCFDKCGYLYRRYSYTDQAEMCKNLFAVLIAKGSHLTITSPSTKQPPTEAWCVDRAKQLTLNVEAPVVLKTGIKDSSRTIASVIVDPEQKIIEYQVSEINEGITLEK